MSNVAFDLPFVYEAEFITVRDAGRRTRRFGRFSDVVPVEVCEVSSAEFEIVLCATGIPFRDANGGYLQPGTDAVYVRGGGFLYRPLHCREGRLSLAEFTARSFEWSGQQWSGQITAIPPPPASIAGPYGARAATLTATVEISAKSEGWSVVETLHSDRHQRWGEAHAHYEEALVAVDGCVWARCGEPTWYLADTSRAMYQKSRNSYFAVSEFPIDDCEALQQFVERVGILRPRAVPFDTEVAIGNWHSDRTDYRVALAHSALNLVRDVKRHTTREQRRVRGCKELFDHLTFQAALPGPLAPDLAASIIDDAVELVEGLRDVLTIGWANNIRSAARLLRARLEVERAREAAEVTEDDEAAVQEAMSAWSFS